MPASENLHSKRLPHCSKNSAIYSMTSSAMASIVGGTEIPSALAVRRLITNSNPGEKKSLGEPHVVAAP
jgi:hypothetical protein